MLDPRQASSLTEREAWQRELTACPERREKRILVNSYYVLGFILKVTEVRSKTEAVPDLLDFKDQ